MAKPIDPPITTPDDPRVLWDNDKGRYYLKGTDPKMVLVFVGAALGPVEQKGILQITVDPAAVRVAEGETLRWIIMNVRDQQDTTQIQIVERTGVDWPFHGGGPNANKPAFTGKRDRATGKVLAEAETLGHRKKKDDNTERRRAEYSIEILFQESPNAPTLRATLDPDVVYDPPGQ